MKCPGCETEMEEREIAVERGGKKVIFRVWICPECGRQVGTNPEPKGDTNSDDA